MSITFPPLPGDWECGRFFDPEELRARDIEVARVVLEGVAKLLDANALQCSMMLETFLLQANAVVVRSLEIKHAD